MRTVLARPPAEWYRMSEAEKKAWASAFRRAIKGEEAQPPPQRSMAE